MQIKCYIFKPPKFVTHRLLHSLVFEQSSTTVQPQDDKHNGFKPPILSERI